MKGKLDPSHPIPGITATMGDFWSWGYSNLLENTVRPAFAEFLVGQLLGVSSEGRKGWNAWDLLYGTTKVEVKSSAYVQTWHNKKPSPARFDIAPKTVWEESTANFTGPIKRQADVYVFCLYPERDRTLANPLNVPAWQFWVVASSELDAHLGAQKSLGLPTLNRFASPISAGELKAAVDSLQLD